jgi:hypothetical protein
MKPATSDIEASDQEFFIGRKKALHDTQSALATVDQALLQEAVGIYGAGKSTLLRRLKQIVGLVPSARSIHLDIDAYALNEAYRSDQLAELREGFEKATQLMTWLAEQTGSSRDFSVYTEGREIAKSNVSRINLHIENRQRAGWRGQIVESGQKVDLRFSKEKVVDDLRAAMWTATDGFIEGWERWANRKKLLLTVDGFEHVIGQEVGRWFLDLTSKLKNTVVVLVRVPSQSLGLPPGKVRSHLLENFTVEEVRECLAHNLASHSVAEGVAKTVHEFTGGHPGGVDLAAKLIEELGPEALDRDQLAAVFRKLPEEPAEKWAGLVNTIMQAVADPDLRAALDACSVLRYFDGSTLSDVLGSSVPGGARRASDLLLTLKSYGLTEGVDWAGAPEIMSFRLQGFIRGPLDRQLATLDPRRYDTLHRRAARHYFEKLSETEEDEQGQSYGGWYRYEDPKWQALEREWLYHTGHTATRRWEARLQFAGVFLDALWWLGCYVEFSFCRWLLKDWERVATEQADGVVREALTTVLGNYPTGYRKPAGRHWDEVRRALIRLRDEGCALPKERANLRTGQQRHVAALINVFLAHARRYQDPADRRADGYYEDATALFRQTEDPWNEGWMAFETADLHIDRKEPDEALSRCAEAASIQLTLRRSGDTPDEELTANIHRAWADAHWLRQDWPAAFDGYGRAILHAYLFQGTPHPPDVYTQRFYQEMLERTTGGLIELWHGDHHEEAVAMANQARSASQLHPEPTSEPTPAIEELLDQQKAGELARALFPSPPLDSERELSLSAFMDRWRDAAEGLGADVGADLEMAGGTVQES